MTVRCTLIQITKCISKQSSANKRIGNPLTHVKQFPANGTGISHRHHVRVPLSSQSCQRFVSTIDKVVPQ